jgi:hypothetical protein
MSTQNTNSDIFNAADPALGYIYQCRYALWLLLQRSRTDEAAEVSIERLDDIAFDKGTSLERLQTKHSITRQGSLSDASTDLWKTLRVWSEGVLSGRLVVPGAILCLVTTAAVSPNSIASLLLPESNGYVRDEASAAARLEAVTQTTQSQQRDLLASHAAFMRLTPTQRFDLLKSVYILASQPTVVELKDKLCEELRPRTYREHLDGMVRGVEGWWFDRVIQHLAGELGHSTIRASDLDDIIQDIRDSQKKGVLPLNWCFAPVPGTLTSESEKYTFVKQLRVINCGDGTVSDAVCDYYRASQERSQWIRERLLFIEEWERYNLRLTDEWRRHFNYMMEDLNGCADPDTQTNSGRKFYRETQDRQVPIRPDCSHPTVMRGAFHRLADDCKVGWHPRWAEMFPPQEANDEQEVQG